MTKDARARCLVAGQQMVACARGLSLLALLTWAISATPAAASSSSAVVGDAMPEPLTSTPGDAARGRAVVANRQLGLCLLCHSGPFAEERVQGNVSTNLAGTGSRWTQAQLRLRIADARSLNPASVMPSFHKLPASSEAEARRIGAAWRGKPILDAQQIEDVVAFLATLRD